MLVDYLVVVRSSSLDGTNVCDGASSDVAGTNRKWKDSYTISGATCKTANSINGIFERSMEYTGNVPVYQKKNSSQIWLIYHSEHKQWIIQSTAKKYTASGSIVIDFTILP